MCMHARVDLYLQRFFTMCPMQTCTNSFGPIYVIVNNVSYYSPIKLSKSPRNVLMCELIRFMCKSRTPDIVIFSLSLLALHFVCRHFLLTK